jgi:hypothetical protein
MQHLVENIVNIIIRKGFLVFLQIFLSISYVFLHPNEVGNTEYFFFNFLLESNLALRRCVFL